MSPDVVVVGAGPAGLATAWSAASKGADVIVLDRKEVIGQPVRTSGGTWVQEMKLWGVPERLYKLFRRTEILGPKGRKASFEHDPPIGCILDVSGFYQFLAEKAVKAGAKIYLETVFEDILVDNGVSKILKISGAVGGEIETDIVVDASGTPACVARRLGLVKGTGKFGIGLEEEGFAEGFADDSIVMVVGNEVIPGGYGWVAPKPNGKIIVGVGIVRAKVEGYPRHVLSNFKNYCINNGVFSSFNPVEVHKGCLPCGEPISSTVADGCVVVGDSAVQASQLIGEGIRYAVNFGFIAGEVIANSIKNKNVSKKFLSEYETRWRSSEGRNLERAMAVQRRLASFSDDDWARAVRRISELDMGTATRMIRGDLSNVSLLKMVVGKVKGKVPG